MNYPPEQPAPTDEPQTDTAHEPDEIDELLSERQDADEGGEAGTSAVEYAVMLALIIVVVIGAVIVLGNQANAMLSTLASKLT